MPGELVFCSCSLSYCKAKHAMLWKRTCIVMLDHNVLLHEGDLNHATGLQNRSLFDITRTE
jgi:hypothetical protein